MSSSSDDQTPRADTHTQLPSCVPTSHLFDGSRVGLPQRLILTAHPAIYFTPYEHTPYTIHFRMRPAWNIGAVAVDPFGRPAAHSRQVAVEVQ